MSWLAAGGSGEGGERLLMPPWLAGTALLHSLAVTEQRAGFQGVDVAAVHLRLLAVPAGHLPRRARGAASVHAFA